MEKVRSGGEGVRNAKGRKRAKRKADEEIKQRGGVVVGAFLEVLRDFEQVWLGNEFLSVRIDRDGMGVFQAFAKLDAFGLVGCGAAGNACESDLMLGQPGFKTGKLSFGGESVIKMQVMVCVERTKEVDFAVGGEEWGFPTQTDARFTDNREQFGDEKTIDGSADHELGWELIDGRRNQDLGFCR